MDKEKKILEFLEKGILLSPDLEDELDSLETPDAEDRTESGSAGPGGPLLLDKKNKGLLGKKMDWNSFDEAKVAAENGATKQYEKILELAANGALEERGIRILRNYTKKSRKRRYEDFVAYFNQRFKALSGMLRKRSELQGATAIARLKGRGQNEHAALIAMIKEKSITKNKNVMLTLEDQTGEFKALITQKKKELYAKGRDLVLDEVIGVTGNLGDGILFINELYTPDVPITHELKKGPNEEYLVIIGDPQVGGKEFLVKDFTKMLAWLRGELGSDEQRAVAKKVKYVIVIGDLVEGVGVYPGQEKDLVIKDIKEQYEAFTELIRQIPTHIEILCIPGNHDAGRIAEPQPPIYKDFAAALYALPNVTMLSSPSWVTIGTDPEKGFGGFTLLLYHGYSLIYYADNVPSIRERGGQKRAELIMKFLLQRRHLAPTHKSNLYIPDPDEDPLVIDQLPDLFITGHIHRISAAVYRGVSLINASAWCDITDDQEKRGLEPQPARLSVVNLQTRDVKVINFYSGKGRGVADAPGPAPGAAASDEGADDGNTADGAAAGGTA